MLTQQVRHALEAELDHVERQLETLSEKAQALRLLLNLEESRSTAALEAAVTAPHAPAPAPAPEPRVETARNATPEAPVHLVGMGLRESLKVVIAQQPGGLKAGEIVQRLEGLGYRPGGRSSTRVLVYGEIYRMLKQHKLIRRGGRYTLPSTSAN